MKNAGNLILDPKDQPSAVKSAYKVSNESGMSKEELELQYKKREFIAIQRRALTLAAKQGMEQGLEKGLKQGIDKAKLEMAKNMKCEGVELSVIAKVTGLNLTALEMLD